MLLNVKTKRVFAVFFLFKSLIHRNRHNKMDINKVTICCFILLTIYTCSVLSIRCYQCSSQQDRKGHDSCGAYKRFNKTQHIAIECNSDESHMPGSFCMKVVQQGPRGFIWDGRWRQVIRRCASVAETGVTGVCNWGVYENGVYWEECYCAHDACNGSNQMKVSVGIVTCLLLMTSYLFGSN